MACPEPCSGCRARKQIRNAIEEGAQASKTAENAFQYGYKYHPRIRERALRGPSAHNFPYSFDDIVLSQNPAKQKDGSLLYTMVGAPNGNDGIYEIVLHPTSGVILHRTWRGSR